MQLRYACALTGAQYVTQRAWEQASLPRCPLHPNGGCGFARHGTYTRVTPPGTRVARWYCRRGHRTFSLLPDCLAARLSGTLSEVEAVVRALDLDMYKSIGWELGLPIERNRAAAFRAIRGEVSRLTLEARQRPVLIVDEAHHLRNEVLEDLRRLTNYQMDSQNRLCLLLGGLTELRRRLAMAVHESLTQRIVVRYHLAGLSREELPQYLTHRLVWPAVNCRSLSRPRWRRCCRPPRGCRARSTGWPTMRSPAPP